MFLRPLGLRLEHNYLPVQEIQEQIRDENVSSIEVQEGTCYLDNQYVLPT